MGTISTCVRFEAETFSAMKRAIKVLSENSLAPVTQKVFLEQVLRGNKIVLKAMDKELKSDAGIPATVPKQTPILAASDKSVATDLISFIFEHWRKVMARGAGTKLTANRVKRIKARLAEGYTVEQIKQAIDGCKMSTFHMGDNDGGTMHNDIELICRSGEKLEGFIGRVEVSPAAVKEGLRQAKSESRSQARVRVKNPLSTSSGQQDDFLEGSCSRE